MKVDLHVHTNKSLDSIIKPEQLAKKSTSSGIIPAITDHNSISAHKIFQELKVPFIPGEEIRTDRGDLIGLFLNELIPKKIDFNEALDIIKSQGAISYLPHMYDLTRSGVIPKDSEISKIDIIEVFNSRTLDKKTNEKAENFAQSNKKIKAVGSDSHFLFEFGSTFNVLESFDLDNPNDFIKSIKDSISVKKSAPFFVRGTTTLIKFVRKTYESY